MNGIYSENDRDGEPALKGQRLEIVGLFYRDDMEERTYQTLFRPVSDRVCIESRVESVGSIVFKVFFRERSFVFPDMFQSDELVHLTDFFLKSHSREKVFDSFFHRGFRIQVYRIPVAGT